MPMFRRLRFGFFFALLTLATPMVLTLGCPTTGGDGDGDGDGDGGTPEEQLESAYVEFFESCFDLSAPFFDVIEPGFFAQTVGIDNLFIEQVAPLFDNENVVVDDAKLADCTAAIRSAASGCSQETPLGDQQNEDINAVCNDVFVGQLENGEGCAINLECASERCTANENDCLVCTPPAAAGESCAMVECGEDLQCNDNEICAQLPTLGEDCTDFGYCDVGYCDEGATNLCEAPAALGEDCAATGFECTEDLSCEDDANGDYTCVKDPVLGDACVPDTGACRVTSTGLVCVDLDEDDAFTCTPIVAVGVGEVCDASLFDSDAGHRWCLNGYSTHTCVIPDGEDEGTCEPFNAEGDACEALEPCAYQYLCPSDQTCLECVDNVCVPPAEIGASCEEVDCVDDAYCDENLVCALFVEPEMCTE